MLIGLCGLKGSGKDTAGAYLEKRYECERRSFATPLKQTFAALFDIPVAHLEKFKNDDTCRIAIGYENDPWSNISNMTVRQGLQTWGKVARDVFGEDFWVNQCLPLETREVYKQMDIVVTDVRYPNECERIKALNGHIWQIYRKSADTLDPHESENIEALLPYVDWTIMNNGSIQDLHEEIDATYDDYVLGIK